MKLFVRPARRGSLSLSLCLSLSLVLPGVRRKTMDEQRGKRVEERKMKATSARRVGTSVTRDGQECRLKPLTKSSR